MNLSTRSIVALTLVMVGVYAGSGWASQGIATSVLGRELVLIAANTLPLLALRRNPLLVVLIFGVTFPIWVALGHPVHELQSLPTAAAMLALGAWDRALRVRAIGLVVPVWIVVGGSMFWIGDFVVLVFVAALFLVVWGAGVVLAVHRTRDLDSSRGASDGKRDEVGAGS